MTIKSDVKYISAKLECAEIKVINLRSSNFECKKWQFETLIIHDGLVYPFDGITYEFEHGFSCPFEEAYKLLKSKYTPYIDG
tara:strand:- start:2166 stop:2411 length:246 start_codon:yes stop_codon:yes gene_type:complete